MRDASGVQDANSHERAPVFSENFLEPLQIGQIVVGK